MASRGKKKTTMAKLARESKLRERQMDKRAKKDARKNGTYVEPARLDDEGHETELLDGEEPGVTADQQVLADA